MDKGTGLLKNRRYEEAAALLEVAGQQWPAEKQLEKLLSSARKSIDRQMAEQQKSRQPQLQVAQPTAGRPRRLLLISAVGCVIAVGHARRLLIRFVTRPHVSVLTVESFPSGAEVEVDGRKCTTPHCSFQLSAGATYSVKADLTGTFPAANP